MTNTNDELGLNVLKADFHDYIHEDCNFYEPLAYLSIVRLLTSDLSKELWDSERCISFVNNQIASHSKNDESFHVVAYQHLAKALEKVQLANRTS